MLQNDDLERFLRIHDEVMAEGADGPQERGALRPQTDGLFAPEIRRLSRSVAIACILGDASDEAASAIQQVHAELDWSNRYADLGNAEAWKCAIRKSAERIDPLSDISDMSDRLGRESYVGSACLRLKNKGYDVLIGAYGPHIGEDSRENICRKIDAHLAKIGGLNCLQQICRIFRESNRVHDGMWLFGDWVPGVHQVAEPAIPFGWLLSLSMRHLNKVCLAAQPELEWASAIELATDFAATIDCQRYSPYEQIDLQPSDFYPSLAQSLAWRELFALPQVPTLVIDALEGTFHEVDWPIGSQQTESETLLLIDDVRQLMAKIPIHGLCIFKNNHAEKEYPYLWRHGQKSVKDVNKYFLSPFSMDKRNHDATVLFDLNNGDTLVLPRSMALAAACEVIFGNIWKSLGTKKAADLVGDVVEKCVARACRGGPHTLVEREIYTVKNENFEIDVGVRTDKEIVLFEMKAKTLTSKARSGDMFAFIDDYTKSYLHMAVQLFRHEYNIRSGFTSLATDDGNTMKVVKVAVSPLSFGPASDRAFANALLRSVAFARMHAVDGDKKTTEILEDFNESVENIMNQIMAILPADAEEVNLHGAFFDLFWLDLGQLLYVLDRAGGVENALNPMRHITFSTRDFWTEVFLIDKQGLTRKNGAT